jgi:hypothetical protein
MLQEANEDNTSDIEKWFFAHVIQESVHPTSKERILRVRYKNGEEADVCEGAPAANPPKSRSGIRKPTYHICWCYRQSSRPEAFDMSHPWTRLVMAPTML